MLIEKILIATDFSKPSVQLIQCIPELKALGLHEVVLVHVIDIRSPGGAAIPLKSYDEQMLNQMKAELEGSGLQVKAIVALGFPAGEIVQIAQQENVSMILIASHGEGFIKQILLGSTAADVVRLSKVPVLVEKYQDVDRESLALLCRNKFAKILIPIDFSAHSFRVLKIIKQSQAIVGEVILLHVIERAASLENLQVLRMERTQQLKELKQDLEAVGLKVAIRIEVGAASEYILTVADEEAITCIIIASRGEGLIKGLLLGVTAEVVTRKSKRPVVLIPSRS